MVSDCSTPTASRSLAQKAPSGRADGGRCTMVLPASRPWCTPKRVVQQHLEVDLGMGGTGLVGPVQTVGHLLDAHRPADEGDVPAALLDQVR